MVFNVHTIFKIDKAFKSRYINLHFYHNSQEISILLPK